MVIIKTPRVNFWRSVRQWWLIFLIPLLICFLSYGQTTLLVCVPGKQNTPQIKSGFDALVGMGKTMVFGRIKDLEATIATTPDAAVIASAPFFEYVQGYKTILVGKVGNQTDEKYMIVSASKEISKDNISDKKVGIVDFLGRERLSLFIKSYFGMDIKSLKRVNKDEDLLTMLGMETVDAIIVSSSQYKEILSNTKRSLSIVATSEKNVHFILYTIKNGTDDDIFKKLLLKAPKALEKELGIDTWEVVH
jgi:hypothetical protein